MSILLRKYCLLSILYLSIFSCGNGSQSESQETSNSPSTYQKETTESNQDNIAYFSMKVENQVFQFQESKNADMHILGGTVGGLNITVNINWETSDSEYGAQLMIRAIPEKQKIYKKIDPKAKSVDGSASFVFTRTKADDFLMLVNDYEVLVEEYEYKNDSGFFTDQKLTCTITGTVNTIDMQTKEGSVLPFEAKIKIAE